MVNPNQDAELMQTLELVGRRGFAYAWQMLRNHDDALDAVQTALTAVWQHRRRLRAGRDPRGWFYRVLRNKCVDVLRSRRVHQPATLASEPPDRSGTDPARAADRREELKHLRQALEKLPEQMREIVLLRDFHDLAYAEIATVLDIPPGTVMSRLHRARSALRQRLLAKEHPDEQV
ncbi:MAG: RNA polymerase sigma factor [Phycisphaerae bacterium]